MSKVSIGEFLSILRKGKGLTQEDIADKLGVSAKTVSSWENDRTYPDIMMLPVIADLFNVTVDELVRGEKNNSLNGNAQDVKLGEKSLLKIRKMKYAKYKEKKMIFTIAGIFSTLLCLLGCYLLTFVKTWTMVFAIIGFLAFVTFVVLLVIEEKSYLRNEGIVIEDDITDDNKPMVLTIKLGLLRSLMLATLPYLIYGLIFIIIETFNPDAFVSVIDMSVGSISNSVTIDYTQTAMIIAAICLVIGLASLITCIVLRCKYIKKYCLENYSADKKKNIKLLIMLGIIYVSIFVISSIVMSLPFEFTNVYYEDYICDTYEELINKMNTYVVDESDLVAAGLNYGDEYILNIPEEVKNNYLLPHGIYDLGNGFVWVEDVGKKASTAKLYKKDEETEELDFYDNITTELYAEYDSSNTVESIRIQLDFNYKTGEYNYINIPSNIVIKDYDEEDNFYFINLEKGRYEIDNYVLIIEANDGNNIRDGLYYRTSADTIIEDWVQCYYADYYCEWIQKYSWKDCTDIENLCERRLCISNVFPIEENIVEGYVLGVKLINYNELGYIEVGDNEGKYGYISYTVIWMDELYESIVIPIMVIATITELTIGFILWKKHKYTFTFEEVKEAE